MEEKMKAVMAKMQEAMSMMGECMGTGAGQGASEEHPSEMPDQDASAEEGDYSGKGLMAKEKPAMDKKSMIMSMMKKKGY